MLESGSYSLGMLNDKLKVHSAALGEAGKEIREEVAGEMISHILGNDAFYRLIAKNTAPYTQMMAYYECALQEMETKFRVLDTEFGVMHDRNPIENIKTRLKSPESLAKKLKRKGFPFTIESIEQNIFDVAGLRVVCSFLEDMYTLADALVAQDDIRLLERRDYVANPKPSGYRSLHLIVEIPIFLAHEKRLVKVEVQFRTISMNFWATLEHQLRYKKDLSEAELDHITKELTDLADASASMDMRMQRLRYYLDNSREKRLEENGE